MAKTGIQSTKSLRTRGLMDSPAGGRLRSRSAQRSLRSSPQLRRLREQCKALLAEESEELASNVACLRELEVFRYLAPSELDKLLAVARLVELEADETFIVEGEDDWHLYAIVSGSVEVSVQDSDGDRFVVGQLPAGQFVGEAALLLREARSATVTTLEPTRVLRIERGAIIDFIRDNPAAGNKILMMIILNLLSKLRTVNQEFVAEKQNELDYGYVEALVEDFMSRL